MKRLRYIPMSWRPQQASSVPAPISTHLQTEEEEEEETTEEQMIPQREKVEKLREYLNSIEKTPVKRVATSETIFICWSVVTYYIPSLIGPFSSLSTAPSSIVHGGRSCLERRHLLIIFLL